jgi:hypothetical protein
MVPFTLTNPPNHPSWALHRTHFEDGPTQWTAPCPGCGRDADWTQSQWVTEPTIDCDTCGRTPT